MRSNPRFLPPRGSSLPTESGFALDLSYIIEASSLLMPRDNPDAIMDNVSDERLRLVYEAELSYWRGDFERVIRCFEKTEGDDLMRLRVPYAKIANQFNLSPGSIKNTMQTIYEKLHVNNRDELSKFLIER